MSGDILDAIDHTLHDYSTSLDAMRWVPDVPEPEPVCVACGGPVPCRAAIMAATRLGPLADWVITQSGVVVALSDRARRASVTGNESLVGIINRAPPPTDPRARALAARQSRNVGPDGRIPAGRKRRT